MQILSSDGDVTLRVTKEFPEDDYLEGMHVQGLKYLRENNDPNYWPEDTTVVVKVRDL